MIINGAWVWGGQGSCMTRQGPYVKSDETGDQDQKLEMGKMGHIICPVQVQAHLGRAGSLPQDHEPARSRPAVLFK
jgi:hypothetical protein